MADNCLAVILKRFIWKPTANIIKSMLLIATPQHWKKAEIYVNKVMVKKVKELEC